MLPKIAKAYNVYFEGDNWAGLVEDVTLAKLVRKMEEMRAGGMSGPIEMDLGHEALSMELTILEYKKALITAWGTSDAGGVYMRFLSARKGDSASGAVEANEFIVRARPKELDFGTLKSGDMTNQKVALAISYFRYDVNSEPWIELDPANMIEVVGGVDRQADIKAAIAR